MKAGNARVDGAVDASELAKLSAVELLEGYRAKRFTPRDVIEDVISALERTNSSGNPLLVDRMWTDTWIPPGKTTKQAMVCLSYHDFGPDTVWASFFQKHYELYGRKLKIVEHYYSCTDAPCLRAEAKSVVAKYHPFAVTFYAPGIMPEPLADQLPVGIA